MKEIYSRCRDEDCCIFLKAIHWINFYFFLLFLTLEKLLKGSSSLFF